MSYRKSNLLTGMRPMRSYPLFLRPASAFEPASLSERSPSWTMLPKSLPLSVLVVCLSKPAFSRSPEEEAYVRRHGNAWTLGTAKGERKLTLEHGRFVSTSWKDKKPGQELLPKGTVSDELGVVVGGQPVSGTSGDWALVNDDVRTLAQGEKQL